MNTTNYPISVEPWLEAYGNFESRKQIDTWIALYDRYCLNAPESELASLSVNLFGCFWDRPHLPIAVRRLLNEQFQWKSRRRLLERYFSGHALMFFNNQLESGQHYLPDVMHVSFPEHYNAEKIEKYFDLFTYVYDQFRTQMPCQINKTYALQGYLDEVRDEQAYLLLLTLYNDQGRQEDWNTLAEQYYCNFPGSTDAMRYYIQMQLARGHLNSAHNFALEMQNIHGNVVDLQTFKLLLRHHPEGRDSTIARAHYESLALDYPHDFEAVLARELHDKETELTQGQVTAKDWALALGAIVQFSFGWRVVDWGHDDESSPESIELNQQLMMQHWGIGNRVQLLNALEDIYQNGHQQTYNLHRKPMECLPLTRLEMWQQQTHNDPALQRQLEVVRNYRKTLGAGGIRAIDASSAFYLCKVGMSLGFIDEEQADTIMLRFARMIQPLFPDWEHYAISYAAGEQFADPTFDEQKIAQLAREVAVLLTDKYSPWRHIPWSTPLFPN